MICPTCGTENSGRRRKCKFCGNPLISAGNSYDTGLPGIQTLDTHVKKSGENITQSVRQPVSLEKNETVLKELRPARRYISRKAWLIYIAGVIASLIFLVPILINVLFNFQFSASEFVILIPILFYLMGPTIFTSIGEVVKLKRVRYLITSSRVIVYGHNKGRDDVAVPISEISGTQIVQGKGFLFREYYTVVFIRRKKGLGFIRVSGKANSEDNALMAGQIQSDQTESNFRRSPRIDHVIRERKWRAFAGLSKDEAEYVKHTVDDLAVAPVKK